MSLVFSISDFFLHSFEISLHTHTHTHTHTDAGGVVCTGMEHEDGAVGRVLLFVVCVCVCARAG